MASDFYPDRRAIDRFRFALIDASMREALPAHWPQVIIAPTFLGNDTERCPALIDLSALPDPERANWCDEVQQQTLAFDETALSLLLCATSPIQALATHLARRMVIRTPGQDRPMQWRFFDPGTFLQLPHLLSDEGMAWLLGPIDAVQVPWAGHWTEVVGHMPTLQSQFQLRATQISALLRIGVVNRVAAQNLPAENASAWVTQCKAIDAHVLRAQFTHGLIHRDDLVAFAHDSWTHHPRIDEHPRMRALLNRLRQAQPEDELDYRELRSRLQEQDWAVMTADLQEQNQQGRTL